MRKNPYIDWFNSRGHDFVEIGGIKWATCNIGAEKPWEPGLYFQWGDTRGYSRGEIKDGKKRFNWGDYKFGNLLSPLKYNEFDGLKVLCQEDDAVHAAWGGRWRMPTCDDYKNLLDCSSINFVRNYGNSGVNGFIIKGLNITDGEMFVPLAGYACDGGVYNFDSHAIVWTSSANQYDFIEGLSMSFHNILGVLSLYRVFGAPIRGVLDC